MRALRLPRALPASLRSPSLGGTVVTHLRSLSQGAGRLAPASLGLCSPVAHPAGLPRRSWGLPGSWADPCARAPLSDPGGTSTPGPCGVSMLPVTYISAPTPTVDSFEALSRGIRTRCLRFAGRVAPPPRKTRFRLVASLCRAGLPPAGSTTEGFEDLRHPLPPPQASPGAICMGYDDKRYWFHVYRPLATR
jgi:hypothetical protein